MKWWMRPTSALFPSDKAASSPQAPHSIGRARGERSAARVAAEDLDVGPATTAKSDDFRRLAIGDAATNQLQKGSLAHSSVLEIRQRSAGEDRLARGAAMGGFQNNFVGEARETHGLRFAGPQPNL